MKISQIIDKINDQQLFVPAFQREYVWKRNNAKKSNWIFDQRLSYGHYANLGYKQPAELKGDYVYETNTGPVKLILDGPTTNNYTIYVDDRRVASLLQPERHY